MTTHSFFIKKVITVGFFAAAAALIVPTSTFAEGGHDSTTEKGHKGSGGSDKGHGGSGTTHGSKKSGVVGGSSAEGTGKKGSTTKPWSHDGLPTVTTDVDPITGEIIKTPVYVTIDGIVQYDANGNPIPVLDAEGNPVYTTSKTLELGRLNAGRAPQKVLDKQIWEALNSVTDWSLYTVSADLAAVIQGIKDGTVKVDSPLQNLALYKEILLHTADSTNVFTKKVDDVLVTHTVAEKLGSASLTDAQLAAIFLAGASDKTEAITAESVQAINIIMGITLPAGITNESLAADANAIRQQILKTHDGL